MKHDEVWATSSPWNLVDIGSQRLEVRALTPSPTLLRDCLAIIAGVPSLLKEMGPSLLPESWQDVDGIGLMIGLCARDAKTVEGLSPKGVADSAGDQGPGGRLSDADAGVLAHFILRQQRSGALRLAIETLDRFGGFSEDQRLELINVIRKSWADLNYWTQKDCLQLLARTGHTSETAAFFEELLQHPGSDGKIRSVLKDQIAEMRP